MRIPHLLATNGRCHPARHRRDRHLVCVSLDAIDKEAATIYPKSKIGELLPRMDVTVQRLYRTGLWAESRRSIRVLLFD